MKNANVFTDTSLKTRLGEFQFRVYNDTQGKETIVLFTKNLNRDQAVPVRVHSECITSEVFGSLHCDCGEQLNKSLELIKEVGGVFIFLRQEGRGIGLFEKIKAYALQEKGLDTVDANLQLGHQRDQRSYEMVKTVLDDMGINKIHLITNNPSKVSEISKLGITVESRIPLCIKPNKINEKYFETKKQKFQHAFTDNSLVPYYFQFKVNSADEVKIIHDFLKNKKKDPLQNFAIGINIDSETLNYPHDLEKIEQIIQACLDTDLITPILHFSFLCSSNPKKDLEKLKQIFPNVKRLQVNDLDTIDLEFLKTAASLFQIDLPLSEEEMMIFENPKMKSFIKENNILIAIDNSKGRGIADSKEKFISIIDRLLNHGINNIALHGGFGPDSLDTYFFLKRYYKFNFSIDSESRLKTDGRFDLKKVKLYLSQLIRSEDPKAEAIDQTKTYLAKTRREEWESVEVEGTHFQIHPKVFHPGHFPSSKWFYQALSKKFGSKSIDFCEVGCGSGVISCLLALNNPSINIVATDLNTYASFNTLINAKEHQLADRIKVFNGDVLDGVNESYKFDYIFWALPFGYLDPGTELSTEDLQVFDSGYRATRKFFETATKYLKPDGEILLGFSKDLGNTTLLYELAEEFNLSLKLEQSTVLSEEKEVSFELLVAKSTEKFAAIRAS